MQRLLLGANRRATAVTDRAGLEFVALGLTKTRERNGVLVFVSLFERKIVILADHGFAGKVKDEEWKAISDRAALTLRKGRIFDALSAAMDEVGAILGRHFPGSGGNDPNGNELSNEVRRLK